MNRRQLVQTILAGGGAMSFGTACASQKPVGLVSARDGRVHQDYLDTDSGQLYYWTAGSGPNLVLIHQSGNSSEEYAGLVPLLADRFRLIALDLPGHGRSDDPSSEPTVEDYANAVQAVLDHLQVSRTHVLGHHGGALAAMRIAATDPERVDKMILSGTGGIKSPAQVNEFMQQILKIDVSVRRDSDFVAETWDRYVGMMSDGARYTDIMKPFLATLEARLRPYRGVVVNLKWDRRASIAKLRGPVLLLQGDKDQFVSGQESLLDIIPNSSRIEMVGCGTFMFYDRPDLCAPIIADYLQV